MKRTLTILSLLCLGLVGCMTKLEYLKKDPQGNTLAELKYSYPFWQTKNWKYNPTTGEVEFRSESQPLVDAVTSMTGTMNRVIEVFGPLAATAAKSGI